MVRLIEALNYRCLRYIQQPLKDVQVLIGPNASGKTAFLDVVSFLGDLVEHGLTEAITSRAASIEDLFFRGEGDRFELAVELEIPEERREMLDNSAVQGYRYVRYEIAIGLDAASNEYQILDEQVLLQAQLNSNEDHRQRTLFPDPQTPPKSIVHTGRAGSGHKPVLRKIRGGNDNFYPEVSKQKGKGGWMPSIRLGPRKSALANMPDDEQKFPVTTWLRNVLVDGAQRMMLNSLALR
ncbi:MAG: AAA family ATPase, partial [Candidatus Hydrogenedentota bacterium]